jgi:NO-binding membrane sensor protein with MHYT domain
MSHELHHFSMGLWVLFLAGATAVIGSYVGLSCVRQSLKDPRRNGAKRWLLMASLSIGGVGIWLMHFIGMMAFDVTGSAVRYDLTLTLFSALLAVVATLFGLWIVDIRTRAVRRVPRIGRLAIGGAVMGSAVSLMHYSGMRAIRIQGSIEHNPAFVIVSVIIGFAGATAALWLAGVAERLVVRIQAAFVMGFAVVALHYTGMAGVRVTVDPTAPLPSGMTVMALLFPSFVLGIVVLSVPIAALLLAPSKDDLRREESIARWVVEDGIGDRTGTVSAPGGGSAE